MDCVEQHEAEHRADAGHGVEQRQRVGVVVPGGVDDGAVDVAQSLIVVGDERQSHCATLWHSRIGKAFGDASFAGITAIE
jgi:hypothetical protein